MHLFLLSDRGENLVGSGLCGTVDCEVQRHRRGWGFSSGLVPAEGAR